MWLGSRARSEEQQQQHHVDDQPGPSSVNRAESSAHIHEHAHGAPALQGANGAIARAQGQKGQNNRDRGSHAVYGAARLTTAGHAGRFGLRQSLGSVNPRPPCVPSTTEQGTGPIRVRSPLALKTDRLEGNMRARMSCVPTPRKYASFFGIWSGLPASAKSWA